MMMYTKETHRLRKRAVMGPFPEGGTEQTKALALTPRGSCSSIFIRMAPPKLSSSWSTFGLVELAWLIGWLVTGLCVSRRRPNDAID
jgi:hypothetical protein